MDRRGKLLGDEVAKRILHAQVLHRTDKDAASMFASVTSPLGTQSSKEFRLLGEPQPLDIPSGEDPRTRVAEWLRRPDNPYFAKAIVNRVWAHYFGRGLVDPPDDLSPFNAASHPELLAELCRQFVAEKYDLKWLHRTIAGSRTYQQSTQATAENAADRTNYAYFYVRRLPAEVMIDALNQATGTVEQMGMKYYHWPEGLRAVEVPYMPQNEFVAFMLEQFGRSPRNSSVQCDCQRQRRADRAAAQGRCRKASRGVVLGSVGKNARRGGNQSLHDARRRGRVGGKRIAERPVESREHERVLVAALKRFRKVPGNAISTERIA
jgi:hypothetical protein